MMRTRCFRLLEGESDEALDTTVDPLAFKARADAKEDDKAGHKDAANYWRGWAAGSFLTSNKGLTREPLHLIGDK